MHLSLLHQNNFHKEKKEDRTLMEQRSEFTRVKHLLQTLLTICKERMALYKLYKEESNLKHCIKKISQERLDQVRERLEKNSTFGRRFHFQNNKSVIFLHEEFATETHKNFVRTFLKDQTMQKNSPESSRNSIAFKRQ